MNQNEKAHRICEATAKEHGYTARELMPTVGYGSHPACLARQWAMYELREQLAWSWQRIATFFGRDNHSTALLAHKKIKKLKTIYGIKQHPRGSHR